MTTPVLQISLMDIGAFDRPTYIDDYGKEN